MKRFWIVLLALMLCASCAMAEEIAVTQVRASLYSAPAETAYEWMEYFEGTQVEVLGDQKNGFVQVRVGEGEGSLTGWMKKDWLVFGEKALRLVWAERVYVDGTELQTSNLYSQPDAASAVLDDRFCLSLRSVLGHGEGGTWLHVEAQGGVTGFVCLDELEGEEIDYDLKPYVEVEPLAGELTREAAIAYAREVILTAEDSTLYTGMPDVYATAEALDACELEVDVLYYYDEPDVLTYNVFFQKEDTGYLYAGVTLIVKGAEVVAVYHGNG